MVPFLASDLQNLLRSVMNRFIKENVLSSANSFTQVAKADVSLDKNKKTCKELDIGIVTRKELDHLKQHQVISSEEKKHFEFGAKAFLSSTAGTLLEKCPLKFPIVRFLKSLDPQVIGGSTSTSVKLFERLLSCLLDAKRIPEGDVDSIKREYSSFVQEVHDNPKVLEGFQSYSVCEDRVDSFLASHLKSSKYQKLWNLVKCLLVLSHGQAGVERGFSVNKEAMQYHFKERSVVALRIIYDHIQSAGGILNVEIDQPLRNAVKSASSQYRNELKRQKEEEKSREQEEANKEVNDQISTFQAKRKRLLEHCSHVNESAEKLCEL